MVTLATKVSEDEFMKKSVKEQNYIMYGALQVCSERADGHDDRIKTLERKSNGFIRHPLALIGGFFGGLFARIIA